MVITQKQSTSFKKISNSTGFIQVSEVWYPHFCQFGLNDFSDWISLEQAGRSKRLWNKRCTNKLRPYRRGMIHHARFHQIPYREVSMRPQRPVVAIKVPGIPLEIFLKRHFEAPRPEGILQKCHLAPIQSEAYKEVSKLQAFENAGIPVPCVLAWGEGVLADGQPTSFIATLDLEGIPLERHLFRNWTPPVVGEALLDKRNLIEGVALMTRQMHQAGWVHRDYYLGHIFVGGGLEGSKKLAVIDVQRAEHRPGWWIRSRIKDLASLQFSADPRYIRPADRIRFLKKYWGVTRFNRWHRFLIRWIISKSERIKRHTEKSLGIPYSQFFDNKYY
jgi:hypothetical protein